MSNRRGRNRRSKSKRILGMSNTVFYTIISILTVIILVCIFLLYVFDKRDRRKTAEEQERVREQVEQIYETTNKEIGELDNYKTNSIIRISAVGDIAHVPFPQWRPSHIFHSASSRWRPWFPADPFPESWSESSAECFQRSPPPSSPRPPP